MKSSFHEDFGRYDQVEVGSDRAFGLTVGGILLLIAGVRSVLGSAGALEVALAGPGVALVVVGLLAPRRLNPLNRAWMRLGLLLSRVVNPIVLGLIYVTTILPLGLVMRVRGRDLLRLRWQPDAESYWIVREPPGPAPDTMRHQF